MKDARPDAPVPSLVRFTRSAVAQVAGTDRLLHAGVALFEATGGRDAHVRVLVVVAGKAEPACVRDVEQASAARVPCSQHVTRLARARIDVAKQVGARPRDANRAPRAGARTQAWF